MKGGIHTSLAILALLIALPPLPAEAGSINAVVNGKSYHLDASYDWNEDNNGLGVEYEFAHRGAWKKVIMANGFRDSNNKMSYMAGMGLHRKLYATDKLAGFYVYAGLNAFVMTREDAGSNPFPGVLPSISVGNEKFGVNLTYLPKKAIESATNSHIVDPTLSGVLFLQFKVSLDQLTP